jgi:ATPase subunit of ABC transporter with duplicated ATPase domains
MIDAINDYQGALLVISHDIDYLQAIEALGQTTTIA